MIRFVEVKGMGDINDHTFKIRNTTPTTFRIDIDTTKYGPYVSGGLILQVKQETVFQFVCLNYGNSYFLHTFHSFMLEILRRIS